MKKRIEKDIERDILSSLPENDLKFEKIESKIDYGRHFAEKKNRKRILVPIGAASLILAAAIVTPIIVISSQQFSGRNPVNMPKEGSYFLSSISGSDITLDFEVGQRAEITSSTEIALGSIRLSKDEWNYEGRLHFSDGPLSETSLVYGRTEKTNLLFSFDYLSAHYAGSISFRSPFEGDATFEMTISDSSSNTMTLTYS